MNRSNNFVLWAILVTLLAADIMDSLDASITNIAAPSIAASLGGGQMLIQWLGSSYALAMGIFLIIGGRLGDKYGQRKMALIGIAGFTIASLSCGLSVNPTMIILSRLAQGAFGALMIPQGMAIMAGNFPREMRMKAFSVFGVAITASMIAGPILAGFLIGANIFQTGWRSIFLINLGIGAVTFIAAYRVLPRGQGDSSIALDGLGSGLLCGMMFFFIYGLIEEASNGWGILSIAMIGLGAVLFCLFSWRQKVATNPIIKPSLLRNRGFTSGLVLGLVFFAIVGGLIFIISLFLQLGLGISPLDAALELFPLMMGVIVTSILAPSLIKRIGRHVISVGLLISVIGLIALFLIIDQASLSAMDLVPALFLIGSGMGFCFTTIFDFAIGEISPEEAGSASGSLSSIQQLATSIGAAAMTSIFFSTNGTYVPSTQQSLTIIIIAMVACLALVWLLPKKTREEHH